MTLLAASVLAQCLAAGELDDTVDIIGAIDTASPATRAAVAEVQRVRIASGVAGGGKFGGGRWRRVGPWVDVVEESAVDVFGGPEGLTTYYPQIEGGS